MVHLAEPMIKYLHLQKLLDVEIVIQIMKVQNLLIFGTIMETFNIHQMEVFIPIFHHHI